MSSGLLQVQVRVEEVNKTISKKSWTIYTKSNTPTLKIIFSIIFVWENVNTTTTKSTQNSLSLFYTYTEVVVKVDL